MATAIPRWLFAAAPLLACAHARPAPRPDAQAIAEATAPAERRHYVSALAYRHYVDALLARHQDALPRAAAQLREALIFDPESAHVHALLADVLARLGRVADAEEEIKAALALDHGHAPARLLAAQIAAAARRDDEARANLMAALQADPDEADAWRELARLEVSRGRLAQARAAVESLAAAAHRALEVAAASRQGEESGVAARDVRGADWQARRVQFLAAEAFVDLARARAARRDDAGADADFARAAALAPAEENVLSGYAVFLESRRRLYEARELQLRVLARRPDAPEALAALGRLALHAGDIEGTTAFADKLRRLARELAGEGRGRDEDRRELAQAIFRLGVPLLGSRPRESLSLFEAALALVPGNAALTFYRATALSRTGRATDAAEIFEALAARSPRASGFLDVDRRALLLDAQVQAALARARAGQADEACARLRALLRRHPGEESVALALLEAHQRAGRSPEATALLEEAASANPRSAGLLFALASAQDRGGHRAAALAAMRRLLALDPHHAGALNYVGYSLAESGGPALVEAERLLRRAVALRPDDGAVADSLGFCLLKQGKAEEALRELQRADRLSPGDPVILGHLGDAYLAAGKRGDAEAAFRRALRDLGSRSARFSDAEARVEPVRPEIPRFETNVDPARAAEPPAEPPAEPRERFPAPSDSRVRDEIEAKLRSLTAR